PLRGRVGTGARRAADGKSVGQGNGATTSPLKAAASKLARAARAKGGTARVESRRTVREDVADETEKPSTTSQARAENASRVYEAICSALRCGRVRCCTACTDGCGAVVGVHAVQGAAFRSCPGKEAVARGCGNTAASPDWSSDVCSSDLPLKGGGSTPVRAAR